MDVSFIIVNFKSKNYLNNCIKSIKNSTLGISYEIIISNNDSIPLDLNFFDNNIRTLENGTNVGFGKASNLGASIASGEIIFFINPDTEIRSLSIYPILEELSNGKVALVAPKLILPNGDIQPWSAGLEINFFDIIKNNLGIIASKKIWKSKDKTSADWVSGAAFAIKASIFKKINGFDEKFFMYFEDIDLCKRLRLAKYEIIFLPTIEVLHLGGRSSESKFKQKKYYYASQDYYFKKHFGEKTSHIIKYLRKCSTIFS